MKKLYILALLSGIGFTSNAQNFVYSTVMHIEESLSSSFEIYDITFTTPTPEDITFMWENVSNSFNAGWDYSLCDYTGCYVGVPVTGTMTAITMTQAQNGTTGFFKMNIGHQGVDGDGLVEIYVYDSNDYNRGDTVSFQLSATNLSINEYDLSKSINIYPNPATDVVNIDGEGYSSVVIFNGLGAQVKSLTGELNGSIDVSDLDNGIYMVSFENEAGQTFNKRLIIQ